MVDATADKYRITVRNNCADANVMVDPTRMIQVVINLLTNAVKYNRPNGEVTIFSEEGVDSLVLHVRDTGIGIAESEMDRVFEPFTRLEYAEYQAIDGTGIGLALCEFFMQEMGGEISLVSLLGEGSTFSLKIPVAKMLVTE